MAEPCFKGLVVIVTGGSSGIGAEIVKRYARAVANVVFTGRNKEGLEIVKQECIKNGSDPKTISWTVGDISEEATRKGLVDCAVSNYGKIDILVNNAGLVYSDALEKFQFTEFDKVLDVNLASIFKLTCLCIPHLKKTNGNIVNISSIASTMPFASFAPYCMSKAALNMFTRCAALELGPFGVRVNAIAPGMFPTTNITRTIPADQMLKVQRDGKMAANIKKVPLGRHGNLKEVADSVLFISSDKASYISGTILTVDGGLKCNSS